MLATTVTCPRCGVVLKPAQPMPVGTLVSCPKCKVAFPVTGEGIQPGMPPAVRGPVTPSAPPVPESKPSLDLFKAPSQPDMGLPGPPASDVQASPAAPNRAKTLALTFGGILVFLAAGIGLAMWCFSGPGSPPDSKKDERAQDKKDSPKSKDSAEQEKDLEEQKPLVVLPPEDQARVDKAVARGLAYLRKTQNDITGAWPGGRIGCTALPALTLLECGVDKKELAVQHAASYIRVHYEALSTTYDLALAILFLDRLDDPNDKKLIEIFTYRLIAGQGPSGGWSYPSGMLVEAEQAQLASLLRANSPDSPLDIKPVDFSKLGPMGAESLSPNLKPLTVLQPPPSDKNKVLPNDASDNSNTQFAILALWAARRHQIPLERTLALLAQRFRTSQTPKGGWPYPYLGTETPSMTCAGLLGTAVGLGLSREGQGKQGRPLRKQAAQEPSVLKGLTYLSEFVGNPTKKWEGLAMVDLYNLWSIERVAMIYRLPRIGDKDWYPWGAETLVANQAQDGSWNYNGYQQIGTSFGLLFLKRANLARDLTSKLHLGN